MKAPAQRPVAWTQPQQMILSAHIWNRLRGAYHWRELDCARSAALQCALAGMSAEGSLCLTGTLIGHPGTSSDGRVRISALSDPTDDLVNTLKTVLLSASNHTASNRHTIVGWYILNVGVGVQLLEIAFFSLLY